MMIPKGKRWRRSRRSFPLYQFGRRRKDAAEFGRRRRRRRARVCGRRRPKEEDKTDRWGPPVSERERATARRTGPTWAEKRERRFWAGFRPKAKRRLLKP